MPIGSGVVLERILSVLRTSIPENQFGSRSVLLSSVKYMILTLYRYSACWGFPCWRSQREQPIPSIWSRWLPRWRGSWIYVACRAEATEDCHKVQWNFEPLWNAKGSPESDYLCLCSLRLPNEQRNESASWYPRYVNIALINQPS